MTRLVTRWLLGCAILGKAMAFESSPSSVRPLDLGSGPGWIGDAICYGPYRDGTRPGSGPPSEEELREDAQILASHWKLLRTYGASEFGERLLRILREQGSGVKVLLGAWIGSDRSQDDRIELESVIRLANEYPDVVLAVCVGNETQVSWSAHRMPVQQVVDAIREVRARVSVPVTTADDYMYWIEPESRVVAAEVDFITYHAHPMWNGMLLDEAIPWLEATTERVRSMHPGRELVLGETGWATEVSSSGEQAELIRAKAGEAEQLQFLAAYRDWLLEERVPGFWFEAFDENWKGDDDPAHVEKHWGLFTSQREPKRAMAGESER